MFAKDTPPEVNRYLQEAVAAYNDTERAETLLWTAQRMAPERLEVYVALYKFYFYKFRLDDAERVVFLALDTAAGQGGFNPDWQVLTPSSAQWSVQDGPERAYLYSMKALAFIRLRQEKTAEGEAVLAKLQELDPDDQVGGSVISQLAERLREGNLDG